MLLGFRIALGRLAVQLLQLAEQLVDDLPFLLIQHTISAVALHLFKS